MLPKDTEHKGRRKKTLGLTRDVADRNLNELRERARTANRSLDFAYRVERLTVFGSYLTDKPQLGDVDVAYKLTERYTGQRQDRFEDARRQAARATGRIFNSLMDEIGWPERELVLYLKAHSAALSL